MPVSVNEFRRKLVDAQLASLFLRRNYIHDLVSVRDMGANEVQEIPGLSAVTVAASGAVDVSAQSLSHASLQLICNRQPMINIELTMADQELNLSGGQAWAQQVGTQAATQLRNYIDRELASYLAGEIAFDTAGTYHHNEAGNVLTRFEILEAMAALKSNDGAVRPALFVHPYGSASIMAMAEFIPNYSASERGDLGIPMIGSLYGAPVYETNSIVSQRTVASTAYAITGTNTHTITVPAGHGFTPGQLITFDTVTAGGDISTARAISSVTATTIVTTGTGFTNGSATEAGTVTGTTVENLLVDLDHCFVGMQRRPTIRLVDRELRSSTNLQVSAFWGRIARAGRAHVIHTSATSVPSS